MDENKNELLLKAQENLNNAGTVMPYSLIGSTILSDRSDALKLIPQGGICAEVGVAYGDFSRRIIDEIMPEIFYAIDYFSQDDPYCNFWGRDLFRKDNMPHQVWYENRFKEEIKKGIVKVCQGYSWDVLERFEDDYFDYIYLDAGHDFNSVYKDVNVIYKKIKNGGFVQFNDYTVYSIWENAFYGIVPVVNGFLNKNPKCKVIALCLQQFGYYDLLIQIIK